MSPEDGDAGLWAGGEGDVGGAADGVVEDVDAFDAGDVVFYYLRDGGVVVGDY